MTFARFDNSYARLPDRFFVRQTPVPVAAPAVLAVNADLARRLGIDPDRLVFKIQPGRGSGVEVEALYTYSHSDDSDGDPTAPSDDELETIADRMATALRDVCDRLYRMIHDWGLSDRDEDIDLLFEDWVFDENGGSRTLIGDLPITAAVARRSTFPPDPSTTDHTDQTPNEGA